jgi:hypothetical protein
MFAGKKPTDASIIRRAEAGNTGNALSAIGATHGIRQRIKARTADTARNATGTIARRGSRKYSHRG